MTPEAKEYALKALRDHQQVCNTIGHAKEAEKYLAAIIELTLPQYSAEEIRAAFDAGVHWDFDCADKTTDEAFKDFLQELRK